MTTSNTYNQGIAHLAFAYGQKPFCNSSRAIMCTIPSEMRQWTRICAKCLRKWEGMEAKTAAKAVAGK